MKKRARSEVTIAASDAGLRKSGFVSRHLLSGKKAASVAEWPVYKTVIGSRKVSANAAVLGTRGHSVHVQARTGTTLGMLSTSVYHGLTQH